MEGLNKFIINNKLKSLASILDDEGRAILEPLLNQYGIKGDDIGDCKTNECQYCKEVKHIDLFIYTIGKQGQRYLSKTCKVCHTKNSTEKSLLNECVKGFVNPYQKEYDEIKDCDDCPLSVTNSYTCSWSGQEQEYESSDTNNPECLKCENNARCIEDKLDKAKDQFKSNAKKLITDDVVNLKIILNRARRELTEYRKTKGI